MTRKMFREYVHRVTGTDPDKSYLVGQKESDDEPIGKKYSKEKQIFDENICFVYEGERATSPVEIVPIGFANSRQVSFCLDSTADTFHKYLIARGECGLENRLKKKMGRVMDFKCSLRQNGINSNYDRVDILL